MKNYFDIKNKKAIITGASSGLGKQFAYCLAENGANIAILARRIDKLEIIAKELINNYNVQVIPIKCDISKEEEIIQAIEIIKSHFKTIDILINNAGVACRKPTEELTLEEWDNTLNTNLRGTFLVSKHTFQMMKDKGGSIINIASIAGMIGFKDRGNVAYSASKGGVISLTRCLAAEWAKYGIRVNAISPGYFVTEMTQNFKNNPNRLSFIKNNTLMERWGEEGELNGTLIYLASDASSFVTGQIIVVDGGCLAI